jgi:peptide deformylase
MASSPKQDCVTSAIIQAHHDQEELNVAVRKIIRMGHPNLRRVASPVPLDSIHSPEFDRLLADMVDTLHDYGGIGLAAPQIDVPLRLAIIELPGGPSRYGQLDTIPLTVFINPVIHMLGGPDAGYWEGCLSVPGLRGFVSRPQYVRVDYVNRSGVSESLLLEGFPATVVQHEFDHLDGRLYIDRISDLTRLVFEEEFTRHILPTVDSSPEV